MVLPWVPVTAIRVRRLRGLAVELRGEATRAPTRGLSRTSSGTPVVTDDPGTLLVGEDRDGAGGDRVGGVRRPVGPAAGQRGVEVAGPDPLGAQRQTR